MGLEQADGAAVPLFALGGADLPRLRAERPAALVGLGDSGGN